MPRQPKDFKPSGGRKPTNFQVAQDPNAPITSKFGGYFTPQVVDEGEDKSFVQTLLTENPTLLGLEQGLTLNHADEMKNWLYQKMLKAGGLPEDPNYLNQVRNEYKNAEDKHGGYYGGGQIAGAILPWLTGAGAGMGALEAGTVGGAQGILNRTGAQEALPEDKSVKRAITEHPIATAADILIPAGAVKLANATRGGAEKIAKEADYQAAKAMKAGPQEFLQTNVDKTLEMGRLGRQGKIVTPLANTEEMLSRADDLRNISGEGQKNIYQTIDEQGNHLFSPQKTAQAIEEGLSPTYRTPINKGE